MQAASRAAAAQTALSVVLLLLVLVAVILACVWAYAPLSASCHVKAPLASAAAAAAVRRVDKTMQQIPSGRWLVIGTGLSAAAVILAMDAPLRASTGLREASTRFGGRVLTTLQPAIPVSTTAQAFEFGAWVVDPQLHSATLQTLQVLQMPTVTQYINYSASFMFTHGAFAPLPPVPQPPSQPAAAYASVDAAAAAAWFAHTGMSVADAPTAALGALANLLLPETCIVPAGLGWQSVVLRAIGLTPVQYEQRVVQISVGGSGNSRALSTPVPPASNPVAGVGCASAPGTLTVHYAAGQVETVQGLVLTCAATHLASIQGVLPEVLQGVERALVSVSQGVLVATWAAQDVWWPAVGFVNALAATDTRLGHIVTIGSTTLRCSITSTAAINEWSATIVGEGIAAAATAMATTLKTIFPSARVVPPVHLTFRGWPAGLWLWTAGTDVERAAAMLARPLGPNVPVWWASSDIAPAFQNRVEGAIQSGQRVAAAAAACIATYSS
jgi:hypothetical protein